MAIGLPLTLVATAATANATVSRPAARAMPACTGNSVIVSMPLINSRTGNSSRNNGYVQLWYNYCSGNNWGRTVSNLSGTTYVDSIVYNNVPSTTGWSTSSGTSVVSDQLYSPDNPAGAFGDVVANGVVYYAESDQSGANCEQDVALGYESCIYP
jgi:hypothetical protein